ncbi:MAG: hypothetical protein ACRENK_04340 [Gemmatimonadaceae bacterium]
MRVLEEYFYLIAPTVGLLFWFVVFVIMRAKVESETKGTTVFGVLLAGPLHFYLRGRKYTLTRREIIGWLVMFCVIAAAPFMAALLERG